MPKTKRRVTHKHFQLDARKIRRAQKALNARTETETIERALDAVIAEFDYEPTGRARLTNDALIAMGAGRMGITVVTKNVKDFARLAELRLFSWIQV